MPLFDKIFRWIIPSVELPSRDIEFEDVEKDRFREEFSGLHEALSERNREVQRQDRNAKEFKKLERDIKDVTELSKLLVGSVHLQGESVDHIADNVEQATCAVRFGTEQLAKGGNLKSRNRSLKIALLLVLILILLTPFLALSCYQYYQSSVHSIDSYIWLAVASLIIVLGFLCIVGTVYFLCASSKKFSIKDQRMDHKALQHKHDTEVKHRGGAWRMQNKEFLQGYDLDADEFREQQKKEEVAHTAPRGLIKRAVQRVANTGFNIKHKTRDTWRTLSRGKGAPTSTEQRLLEIPGLTQDDIDKYATKKPSKGLVRRDIDMVEGDDGLIAKFLKSAECHEGDEDKMVKEGVTGKESVIDGASSSVEKLAGNAKALWCVIQEGV